MPTFKPLLAVNSEPKDVVLPSYVSTKYEGVRAVFTPQGLRTRNLKAFGNDELYNVPHIKLVEDFCAVNNVYIEGELYIHDTTFRMLQSYTAENGNANCHRMKLMVFDCYSETSSNAPFEQRYEWYLYITRTLSNPMVIPVYQELLIDPIAQIPEMYATAIEHGYEGVCIKAKDAPYKKGRSTLKQGIFTRIKPERDYDCIVLDIIERQHNLVESHVNELGMLAKRQDKDAKAASGLAQSAIVYTPELEMVHKVSLTRNIKDIVATRHSPSRKHIWENKTEYIGKAMRFVAIPVPGNDVPRSPRFDAWRDDLDPDFLIHEGSDSLVATFDNSVTERMCAGPEPVDVVGFTTWNTLRLQGYALGK